MGFNQNKLLGTLLLALAQFASATTWYVNGATGKDTNNCLSPTSACKTIGHAISLASSGDSITVAAATYKENLTIGISLSVIGAGARTTIIDGGGVKRVVSISSGNVTLAGLTIRHGFAPYGYGGVGAGIFNSGNLLVITSTITGNLASVTCPARSSSCSAAGGGIYNSNAAKLTISQSTVAFNSVQASCPINPCVAGADGGGVFNRGTLTMSNSTLEGNTARHIGVFGYDHGGGIDNIGTAMISSSTVSGNFAGGGISTNVGFSVTLQNSIVSNNSGSNCSGTMISKGYNLSSDSTCNFTGPGDMNNIDPNLGPLQNNGGPTDTMALLPGSPAIDAGNPSGCTDGQANLLKTDQRGMPRSDREDTGGCDIGAYESQTD